LPGMCLQLRRASLTQHLVMGLWSVWVLLFACFLATTCFYHWPVFPLDHFLFSSCHVGYLHIRDIIPVSVIHMHNYFFSSILSFPFNFLFSGFILQFFPFQWSHICSCLPLCYVSFLDRPYLLWRYETINL
jgi:hypothetical protein